MQQRQATEATLLQQGISLAWQEEWCIQVRSNLTMVVRTHTLHHPSPWLLLNCYLGLGDLQVQVDTSIHLPESVTLHVCTIVMIIQVLTNGYCWIKCLAKAVANSSGLHGLVMRWAITYTCRQKEQGMWAEARCKHQLHALGLHAVCSERALGSCGTAPARLDGIRIQMHQEAVRDRNISTCARHQTRRLCNPQRSSSSTWYGLVQWRCCQPSELAYSKHVSLSQSHVLSRLSNTDLQGQRWACLLRPGICSHRWRKAGPTGHNLLVFTPVLLTSYTHRVLLSVGGCHTGIVALPAGLEGEAA
jgi:hypothetical protein